MKLTKKQIAKFQHLIFDFYHKNKRNFIWREQITPYRIVISEIMLQQTQTHRVIPKFENWIHQFPTFASLAQAHQGEALTAWQGLGYNRRGLALHKIAQKVISDFNGVLPQDPNILVQFPSIGPNTAGSICAFAFNQPTIFIETNIRTVFTHEFFPKQTNISDKQLIPLIEQTLDTSDPRSWYYALMDYGVHLKKKLPNINAASKHYTRQSTFKGSKREIRGTIIKILTQQPHITFDELHELISFTLPHNRHTIEPIIKNLLKEGMIHQTQSVYHL